MAGEADRRDLEELRVKVAGMIGANEEWRRGVVDRLERQDEELKILRECKKCEPIQDQVNIVSIEFANLKGKLLAYGTLGMIVVTVAINILFKAIMK